MLVQFFGRSCPMWAAPFFVADSGGGAGDAAPEGNGEPVGEGGEGDVANSVQPGAKGEAEGDKDGGDPSGDSSGSLLSAAGKDGAAREPGKGDGETGEDDVNGEKKDPEGDAPVTKEALVIPEGQEWDEEMGAPLLSVINDGALSATQKMQKIIDMIPAYQDKLIASIAAGTEAQHQKELSDLVAEVKAWEKSSMADPEFGGDMWKANQGVIAKGRDHLATEGAAQVINDHALGSHPEILRMFYRAGKLLGEDPTKGSGAEATGMNEGRAGRAERIFGKSLEGLNIKGADDE